MIGNLASSMNFEGVAALTAAVSAAFSNTGTLLTTVAAALGSAVVAWLLVLGWTRLWNKKYLSVGFHILQILVALIAATGAFLIVAASHHEVYLDRMEDRMASALKSPGATWKRDVFETLRSQIPAPSALGGGATEPIAGEKRLQLQNRADLVRLAGKTWEAAIDAANSISELPFRMDPLLSPGPNTDAANPVFPLQVVMENEWVRDAERSVTIFWRKQAEEWLNTQFRALRLPVAAFCVGIGGLIVLIITILAWRDIKA